MLLVQLGKRVQTSQLNKITNFMYNKRRPIPKQTLYDKEQIAYKNLLKEYRKKNMQEYWQYQTKIENDFIDNFLEEQRLKNIKMDQKLRDWTIYKTYQDTIKHQHKLAKDKRKQEIIKQKIIEQDIQKMNRAQILKMLREESKSWYNLSNLNEQLTQNIVLPEQIIDETDYYLHLQEQALHNDLGQFEELEKVNNQNEAIQWKNRLAMELFQEIVQIVKYLIQKNPYKRIQKEWAISRSVILGDSKLTQQEVEENLDKLDSAFQVLISDYLNEQENSSQRLEIMHKELIQLYNLVQLWQKYTQVIKMNSALAKQLAQDEQYARNLFKNDKDAEKQTDQQKTTEEGEEQEEEEELTADEKYTSSDEEIDIEKLANEKDQSEINKKELHNKINQPGEDLEENEESARQSNIMGQQLIERMISDSNEKQLQDMEKFEEFFNKRKLTLYDQDDGLQDSAKLYKGIDIENIFPKESIDLSLNFKDPQVNFKNYEQILQHQKDERELYAQGSKDSNLLKNPDVKRLQTTVVVESFREQLDSLEINNDRERSLLNQNKRLLDLIAETRIDEPHLLIKLWTLHQ